MSEPEPAGGVAASDEREVQEPPVDLSDAAAVAQAVLTAEGRPDALLSVAIVDDERIAELHVEFMDVPGPTDVISFPLEDDGPGPQVLGDVVVSADTAAREARERGISLREELLRYVVHGTLHLLGYDDLEEGERERMHARQEELLSRYLDHQPDLAGGAPVD